MKEFTRLLEVADQLLGPNGCPWDREQTFFTLQPYLLEETHELIEAIDSLESQKISEELGDCLYALIFIAKLAEAEKRFALRQSIESVTEKLIRRHPHVFGDVKVRSTDDIVRNWDAIKKQEKTGQERKKLFDGIPPSLPALPRAQKMAKKLRKNKEKSETDDPLTEQELGEKLWQLIQSAERLDLDAESALRRKLAAIEQEHNE
ncbi:MAG TPA: MazG family protein [Chlamydiales bacterium]|jgi:MazG family protein|nr:MazG family protein [Chlamydiales bacterium]